METPISKPPTLDQETCASKLSLYRNDSLAIPQTNFSLAPADGQDSESPPPSKRQKIVKDLESPSLDSVDAAQEENISTSAEQLTIRTLQTNSREFPQRKKKAVPGLHLLQPCSTKKFIPGVWKQIFSNVQITSASLVSLPIIL